MALKCTVYEICQRCGERAARLVGNTVWEGHRCPEAPPGPASPPRSLRLSDVNFVRSDRHLQFLLDDELAERHALQNGLRELSEAHTETARCLTKVQATLSRLNAIRESRDAARPEILP